MKKGFTLIETFVAITILMIVVLGPMSLLSNALRDSRYVRDETIATYLAQEGVELVIDYRNNHLSDNLTDSVSELSDLLTKLNCSGEKLKLDESGDSYQCNTGISTPFVRTVKVTQLTDSNGDLVAGQYQVTATVTVNQSPLPAVVASTIIFN